jgi:AcrR family transcriptional regulator
MDHMESKEKILNVAFNLFLQKGYRDVSLKEIVSEVGLTKGAFYHYFDGKEQLFTEVIDNYFLSLSEHIYEQVPKVHLEMFLTGYQKVLNEQIDRLSRDIERGGSISLSYYFFAFDALRILPDFGDKMQAIRLGEELTWIEVIDNAKTSGEIQSYVDSQEIAKLFISTKDGTGMQVILENRLKQLSKEITTVWSSLYKLIKA